MRDMCDSISMCLEDNKSVKTQRGGCGILTGHGSPEEKGIASKGRGFYCENSIDKDAINSGF